LIEGRPIKFSEKELPYFSERTAMIPLRAICKEVDAKVVRSRDGDSITIARGQDRIEYVIEEKTFIFNGASIKLTHRSEGPADDLFVPFEMIQSLCGGGLTLVRESGSLEDEPFRIFVRDRELKFKHGQEPIRIGSTVLVPIHPAASAAGLRVVLNSGGSRITIVRSLDQVVYDQGQRWFQFNGRRVFLRETSMVKYKMVFVPIDLFQALLGTDFAVRQ